MTTAAQQVTAYCVKCRTKNVPMADAEWVTTENGRTAWKGKHADCGTVMFRFAKAQ